MQHEPVVYVVDDDQGVRSSLQALVHSVGFKARGYDSAQAFLDEYDGASPGVIVLDVRMRGLSGLDLQEELLRRNTRLPVIIVTGHGDVPMAVRAMRAGALDFIEKPYRDQELLDRIQQGIEDDLARRRETAVRRAVGDRLEKLTPRERDVLDLVMQGKINKEIAATLGISLRAVESHRARVMERIEAGSVAELVQLVMLADPAFAKRLIESRLPGAVAREA